MKPNSLKPSLASRVTALVAGVSLRDLWRSGTASLETFRRQFALRARSGITLEDIGMTSEETKFIRSAN